MPTIRQAIQTLAKSLDPLLNEAGLARHRLTWIGEHNNELMHVVSLQVSAELVTMNLGVYFPALDATAFGTSKTITREAQCHVRTRIGSLMAEARDFWWNVLDTPPENVSKEIRKAWNECGYPWLERMSDISAVAKAQMWNPRVIPDCYYMAAAYIILGKPEHIAGVMDAVKESTMAEEAKEYFGKWVAKNCG